VRFGRCFNDDRAAAVARNRYRLTAAAPLHAIGSGFFFALASGQKPGSRRIDAEEVNRRKQRQQREDTEYKVTKNSNQGTNSNQSTVSVFVAFVSFCSLSRLLCSLCFLLFKFLLISEF